MGGLEELARPQQTAGKEMGTLGCKDPDSANNPNNRERGFLPKASDKTLTLAHETLSGAQGSPMPDSPPKETVTDKWVLF